MNSSPYFGEFAITSADSYHIHEDAYRLIADRHELDLA